MDQKVLTLTVSAPEDLDAQIENLKKDGEIHSQQYISLAISNAKVLVYPFHYPAMPFKEMINRIKMDAVELVGLPLTEVVFEYQILYNSQDYVKGVVACIPKVMLEKYLSVLDKAHIIPVKITTYLLAAIESFLLKHDEKSERFCFMDASRPNKLVLAVFSDHECELLRELNYETSEEVQTEVIQTLRSANAKSRVKNFDHIYISGEKDKHPELCKVINENFSTTIDVGQYINVRESFDQTRNFFIINLTRYFSFTPERRKQVMMLINGVTIALGLGVLVLGGRLWHVSSVIGKSKAAVSADDLRYAKSLQEKLKK